MMNDRKLRGVRVAAMLGLAALAACPVGACHQSTAWHAKDISGAVPTLALSMTRANDGKAIEADDYRDKVTLLYFGYSFCPDVCPLTLSNLGKVMNKLGNSADGVRVLFVTVDPNRDTLPVLKRYVAAFGPQFDALRGDPNQLATLARRYRVASSVDPHGAPGTK